MKKRITAAVISDKQDKTVVVMITESKTHPIYKKKYKATHKYYVHDEKNEAKVGDTVEIEETRPVSKTKNWTVVKIVKKAQGK